MTTEPRLWVFTTSEAEKAAQLVADHDPAEPRTHDLIPYDAAAAAEGVRQLKQHLERLPKFVQRAMEGAAGGAGQLSDDRLQGLAELIQNADDLAATHGYFAIDETNSRLLFAHNGSGLTLHDILALAVPWLSLKITEDEMFGRFGIGLKTLHSLSDILEVHEGHFHLSLEAQTITPLDDNVNWPGLVPPPANTVFVVPFEAGAVGTTDVAAWLAQWGEAGLVFLRHLTTVTLLDFEGHEVAQLHLDRSTSENVDFERGVVTRRTVTAPDARQWLVYSRRAPVAAGKKRARKAQALLTPVSLAFPKFVGDHGHLHVGLPVRPVGLPFRVHAQFDPLANRRDINDTDWNLALIPLIAQLWSDAALDLFGHAPSASWSGVPLDAEFSKDERTTGRLRDSLETHLMKDARCEFAAQLLLDGGHGEMLRLAELAYEAPELEGILEPADVQQVAETEGTVTTAARSSDGRWREVLVELDDLGAKTPTIVHISGALDLLQDQNRAPAFVASLTAVALEADLEHLLWDMPCLVLNDGTHTSPDDLGDLDVLLPEEVGELWDTLGIGSRLHPFYREADGWKVVCSWLRSEDILLSDASNNAALRALAEAGGVDIELPAPLTDEQARAIRAALEKASDVDRGRLGPGIGRAVRLDATSYDADGKRVTTHARPCEAYIIERDANTWHAAAGQTLGLVWLHRRYANDLRAPSGRDGLGAQRLFRILGAETAPRIIAHPGNFQRYQSPAPGVPRYVAGSPERRQVLLEQHHATYTVWDHASPDLDAVLNDIAAEQDRAQRRRRAAAVLASLSRAWDRLEALSRTMAASEDYGWIDRGQIEAWWLSSAASIPWLTSERGTPAAPGELRIKTGATQALYGNDPDRYLAPQYVSSSNQDVLLALGVVGDAGVLELIAKLVEIRSETLDDPMKAADLAAPVYKALADQITWSGSTHSLGTLGRSAALAAFGRDTGLVATNQGWRRPSVVLDGPPIFNDMRAFVPSVSGTRALWAFLGIRHPGVDDAKQVLRQLASKTELDTSDRMVMLESLRLLAAAKPAQLGVLRRSPVWIGDGWRSQRPIYAVSNPLIAEALKDRLPIWVPGGALGQLDSLIEPLRLTRIDATSSRVLGVDEAMHYPDLTQVYGRAVANLRADLALSDPRAEESLTLPWDEFAGFKICLLPKLRVQLAETVEGLPLTVEVDAWLDLVDRTFFVRDASAAGRPGSGAYAIAAAFTGDTRRIAHDWVVAWSEALAGYEAETIATAASEDADRKRERDEAADLKLREFAERTTRQRGKAGGKPTKKSIAGDKGDSTSEQAKKTQPPRLLVDTNKLTLRNAAGEIIGGGEPETNGRDKGARRPPNKLPEPDPKNPKKKAVGGRVPANYTDEEREDAGMELVRQLLGADDANIVDIRNQHNVGADAVDDLQNFYELKVYASSIPDVVRLQDSQVQRAYETENFFLVVVGNVEQGGQPAEVRVITDPLNRLTKHVAGTVTLSGVQSAKALRYIFDEEEPNTPPDPGPQSDGI